MSQTPLSLLHRLREAPEDADAWRRIDDIYRPLLPGWLRRYSLQQHDADNLVQDILHAVAGEMPHFRYDPARGPSRRFFETGLGVSRPSKEERTEGGPGMKQQEQDAHPPCERLEAFALGRLEDDEAARVADHLGVCESCQEAVLAVPDDSMLSLLRPGCSTPLPQRSREGATTFDDDVPPELRGHARYQVLRRLGAGGMGVVYQCQHRLMGRTVAVKVINKGLVVDAAVVERFQREVRAAARLAHPNLVQAFDAEQAGELHFLVLEFIEGVSLDVLVKRDGPLPVEMACDYTRQAALGLAHAAAQGLVHRDVKPQNIMVTPQGQVKVMDFGLASISAERSGEGGLTEAGQGLGTPDYIAPEQIRDARTADARADIYSLGCTIYFLLSGRPPFPKGNSAQKVASHLEQQPEPLLVLRPELPAGLVQVIDKMMAKDPARRTRRLPRSSPHWSRGARRPRRHAIGRGGCLPSEGCGVVGELSRSLGGLLWSWSPLYSRFSFFGSVARIVG